MNRSQIVGGVSAESPACPFNASELTLRALAQDLSTRGLPAWGLPVASGNVLPRWASASWGVGDSAALPGRGPVTDARSTGDWLHRFILWPIRSSPIRSSSWRIVSLQRLIPFALLVLFIAAVSVHDAALVAVNRDVILEMEQNPIGCWLIRCNAGSVSLFVVTKLLGTSLVCAVLWSLFEHSRRVGFAVALPVAFFQAGLLTYLYTN